MEKTIEYMRTAVLAECELLNFSTEGGFSYPRARTPIEGIGIILMRGKYELSIYGSICQPIAESDSITKLAYSILGLDKRDALEAEQEKIANLEQQLEEAKNVTLKGMESPAWAMLGEFTKFMEEVVDSDVPRTTSWCVRLEDGEEVTLLNIWAATSHDSPITRATELREMLDAERGKNEQLVATVKLLKRLASDINYQCSDFRNTVDKECYRTLEAYREGKKDE